MLAACRTSEESTAKQPNFAEIYAKIVKYIQYSPDFGKNSVVKDYLTTAEDGKEYNVLHYALHGKIFIGTHFRDEPIFL